MKRKLIPMQCFSDLEMTKPCKPGDPVIVMVAGHWEGEEPTIFYSGHAPSSHRAPLFGISGPFFEPEQQQP